MAGFLGGFWRLDTARGEIRLHRTRCGVGLAGGARCLSENPHPCPLPRAIEVVGEMRLWARVGEGEWRAGWGRTFTHRGSWHGDCVGVHPYRFAGFFDAPPRGYEVGSVRPMHGSASEG